MQITNILIVLTSILVNNFLNEYEMIKICFLIVVLAIHALNILLECIEGKHVFQNRRAI